MADSIEEIDHYYSGSPCNTLNKTFLPIISFFSSFPFIKITQGLSIYLEEYKVKKPFQGKKIVICLHLEAKTAYLAKVLQSGGAQVTVTASNQLSTQDDVVAALVQDGIGAFAWYGATDKEYKRHLHQALDCEPDLIIDDGGDLVATLHSERQELIPKILGGAEETTTGILRLKALE